MKSRPLRDIAKRVAARALGSQAANTRIATSVPEATPCNARELGYSGPRLNILLPSINAQHYFGGIHTAVQLYRAMLPQFGQSRIVLIDSAPQPEALARFEDHRLVPSDSDDGSTPRQIVAFSDRYGKTLPVQAGDCWLATSWWTAYGAQRMADWQRLSFDREGSFAYLIQDFEPGFYPWSSQYAMALSTYRPDKDIAVFNTGLLAEHFRSTGLAYSRSLEFEPTLNTGLRPRLEIARASTGPRNKRIVIYGRPSTPRNAFELLCEGLRAWGWSDPYSSEWEVVAPGELLEDLDLGPFRLSALGKLGIGEYGNLLATSAIGVSLMISPHPSYPPLEMAAFGMGVVTNRYGRKDLAQWAPGIRSIDSFTPEAIAEALKQECARWRDGGMRPYSPMDAGHAFLGAGQLEEVGQRLSGWLLEGRAR